MSLKTEFIKHMSTYQDLYKTDADYMARRIISLRVKKTITLTLDVDSVSNTYEYGNYIQDAVDFVSNETDLDFDGVCLKFV